MTTFSITFTSIAVLAALIFSPADAATARPDDIRAAAERWQTLKQPARHSTGHAYLRPTLLENAVVSVGKVNRVSCRSLLLLTDPSS